HPGAGILNALPQPPFSSRPPQRPTAVPDRASRRPRWLKVAGWTFAILLLLILCLAVTAAFLIRSPRVHAYLIQTVQAKATAALNTPVHFRDFSFHLSGLNPSVDVYQVTVKGASTYR